MALYQTPMRAGSLQTAVLMPLCHRDERGMLPPWHYCSAVPSVSRSSRRKACCQEVKKPDAKPGAHFQAFSTALAWHYQGSGTLGSTCQIQLRSCRKAYCLSCLCKAQDTLHTRDALGCTIRFHYQHHTDHKNNLKSILFDILVRRASMRTPSRAREAFCLQKQQKVNSINKNA